MLRLNQVFIYFMAIVELGKQTILYDHIIKQSEHYACLLYHPDMVLYNISE